MVKQPQFETLRPGQKKVHKAASNAFTCPKFDIFIFIHSILQFVPMGPVDNITALIQIMAQWWTDDMSLSEPMIVNFTEAYTVQENEVTMPVDSPIALHVFMSFGGTLWL